MDENGVLLGPMYQSMVLGPSYRELQGDGFLVPVRAVAPDRPDLKGLKSRAGDYSKESLEKRMNRDEMVGSIVEEWKRHSDGRTTVLFASGIQHSIHCRNVFRTVGVTAEHIDGTMETAEREDILERTRDGKVRVLCNYGVLTTGVDIPELKYLICARPTKSFSLWRQMGGRIQRPAPGHDHCFIQDHSDNCLVFGYPDEDVEWDLFGEEDQGKKHQENQRKKKGEDGKPQGDPFQCEKCKTPYRGPHCPNCGTKHERRGKDLEMQAGELKALERERTNRNATPMDKQKFWDECLGWAVGTGRKVGAAAHRYKEKFGVFPSAKVMNVPRNSQWQMKAKDFYMDVVKPQKEALAQELAREQA